MADSSGCSLGLHLEMQLFVCGQFHQQKLIKTAFEIRKSFTGPGDC